MGKAVSDRNRTVSQPPFEGHHGGGAKAAEGRRAVRLIDQLLPRGTEGLRGGGRQRIRRRGERVDRREGDGERVIARNRQGYCPRQLQEPRQIVGFASELLANGGDLGRLAFRLKGSDQMAQLRPQRGGVERFILGQAREIAEQLAEPAQSARPRFLHPLPGLAPPGRDLVIEQGEARIGELQQPQTQKAGDLDRAVRVLDTRQCRGLARHHPPREMLEACKRQIGEHQPVGTQFLQEADFVDLGFEARRPPA